MRLRSPLYLVAAILLAASTQGLENGLARTPPMGWLSWERFLCNIDCTKDPENCISEKLYMTMADIMHTEGYQAVGYQYVNIDDCWMANQREADGRLMANRSRFPNGIKGLAHYIHSKGLKFGIYQDCGSKTCAGYPGSLCHYQQDTQTFAEWGVDMLKLDGCNINPVFMDRLYPAVTHALNATGRKMVFSCSWPAYQVTMGINPNYRAIAQSCNMWRNYDDITDSWVSVLSILDYYASVQDTLAAVSGPGRWSDPDMLIIGNYGLSLDQSRAQMALWAILAAPLFMSVDLRTIRPEHKDILTNIRVIAVNQDRMGRMGRRICVETGVEIWARPILPLADDKSTSAAIVFFNRRNLGGPVNVTIKLSSIALNYRFGYDVIDLFLHNARSAWFMPSDDLTAMVNPSGVIMLKATPRIPPPTPPPTLSRPILPRPIVPRPVVLPRPILPRPTPVRPVRVPTPRVRTPIIKVEGVKGGAVSEDINVVKGGSAPVIKVAAAAVGATKGGVVVRKVATIVAAKGRAIAHVAKGSVALDDVKTAVKGRR